MTQPSSPQADAPIADVPVGNLSGLKRHWKSDLLSGFLVFLIALPLCLGISLACGYPPIAGIFTAVIGGIVSAFISDSELTIKGPAAGLIVVAIGCVSEFGGNGFIDGTWSAADQHAYQLALGVGVAAAVLQIAFGLLRGGILGEFFPTSAVHGMLAAIGIIIVAKQIPVALGESAKGGPIELLLGIPSELAHTNPAVGLIGALSLAIMFFWPLIRQRHLRRIPAAIVVVVVSVPLGIFLGFDAESHTYVWNGQEHVIGRQFLVNVPHDLFSAVALPDFSGLSQVSAWHWVLMFAVIGTLESLLSAKAMDLIDPFRRRTNFDRDNTAVGVGNLLSALTGGLPMISEIVRSRANIDNGARTRYANLYHGLLLLGFVAAVPALISLIPLSALGAMLVYTGFRLAHPKEFVHVLKIGTDQFAVYVATIIGVLATDLLVGIAIGIGVDALLHVLHGAPIAALLRPRVEVDKTGDGRVVLAVQRAAVFTSWIGLKRCIERHAGGASEVVVDLSSTRLVDHTVMAKLHE